MTNISKLMIIKWGLNINPTSDILDLLQGKQLWDTFIQLFLGHRHLRQGQKSSNLTKILVLKPTLILEWETHQLYWTDRPRCRHFHFLYGQLHSFLQEFHHFGGYPVCCECFLSRQPKSAVLRRKSEAAFIKLFLKC